MALSMAEKKLLDKHGLGRFTSKMVVPTAEILPLLEQIDFEHGEAMGARHKLMRVPRQKKGTVDRIGKRKVKESAKDHIITNCLSLPMTLCAAWGAGELSVFVAMSNFLNAILGPIIKYQQKKHESD